MSILLVGLPSDLGTVLARRLIAQDDEVRVLSTENDGLGDPPDAPVHLASGRYLDDADLIERACQNVRTLVLGDKGSIDAAITEIITGASAAGVERVVVCAPSPSTEVTAALKGATLEYVVLATGKKSLLSKRAISLEAVAEAIDAADDIAGPVRLELDLTRAEGWDPLRLQVPGTT